MDMAIAAAGLFTTVGAATRIVVVDALIAVFNARMLKAIATDIIQAGWCTCCGLAIQRPVIALFHARANEPIAAARLATGTGAGTGIAIVFAIVAFFVAIDASITTEG
jgi:hypothetical protein